MEEVERLQEEVEYWRDQYYDVIEERDELEDEVNDLKEQLEEADGISIKDLNHFIWKLKNDGLYNDQLDMFIEEYMKWHND